MMLSFVTCIALVYLYRGIQASDLDPFLAMESKNFETVDTKNERDGRFLNFNPFQIFQLASRRTSHFLPNAPFTGLHQSGSAILPTYSDSGPPHLTRGTYNQFQNNKRNNFQSKPIGRPPNYNQPVDLELYKRPSNSRSKISGQGGSSYTTFSSLDRPAPMQSGFTPIINGQRLQSPLASNKVIHQIKPPHLASPSHSHSSSLKYHASSSTTSAKYGKPISHKQPAGPLLSVPVEKLTKARNTTFSSSQNRKISAQASSPSFYIPSASSLSSSVSSSLVVNSGGKPDYLKSSSSQIRELKVSPQKASDFNCDGSQDLGWCDLGNTYPKVLVQNLMEQCKTVIDSMYVEIPHNFEKLSDLSSFRSELDNASSREARERGNHESWSWASYFHQGSLCEAERGFLRPEAAKDSKGVWNVVIQDEKVRQRIPIEMCRNTNNSCKKMLDCGLKSQCLQKYNYHLLLSLDPSDLQECPTMKLYRFPSACVCHVE